MMLPPHSNGYDLSLKELLQYRQTCVRWLPPARSIWSHLSGSHISPKKGRGMDFAEVRPYQVGDDVRSIDWRITARTGKPYTKLYIEESERPTMLVVDLSNSMQMGTKLLYKSVQAGHLASVLCWLSVAQKDRVGGVVFNDKNLVDCLPVARQEGALHLLNAMVTLSESSLASDSALKPNMNPEPQSTDTLGQSGHVNPRTMFERVLEQLLRLCPKGSDVVFVSDFHGLTTRAENTLLQLSRHNSIRLVHLYDPIECGETTCRQPVWLSDLTRFARVNFAKRATRDAFRQDLELHTTHLAQLSRQLHAEFYSLSSGKALVEQFGGTK